MKSRIFSAVILLALACPIHGQEKATTAPRKAASFSVERSGKGRPMILIPGLTCGGDVWNSTVAHFKDRYECHVLTIAGFAGQPAIPAPMLETVRKDLANYIRDRKLDKPVIVGHSLGGFLAWWLASAEPDLVGPIVAVDGGTFLSALMDPSATVEKAKPQAQAIRQSMETMDAAAFGAQNKLMLGSMLTDPKDVEAIAPTCAKSDPKATALAMYELMTTDLREKVASIKTPTLLIGSSAFAQTPEMKKQFQDRYEGQIARIPNHKVVMAEKARHFIMLDDPEFLFSQMEALLAQK